MNRPPRASTAFVRQTMTPSSPLLLESEPQPRKDHEYLTPRHQSRSAQGSRIDLESQKSKLQKPKTHLKIQSKIPMLTSNAKEQQLKNKINKLGLESFMKDIVLKERISDPQFSSKVIHALNKTYIDDDVGLPRSQFRSSFGKKLLRESRRAESPRVDWNPEKAKLEEQFKQLNLYIPNAMFPCRRDKTTKLLKNKYRKHSPSSLNKPRIDPIQQLLNSQSHRHNLSTNLNLSETKTKRSNNMMAYSNSQRKKNKLFFLNQNYNYQTQSARKYSGQERRGDGESLFLCSKARIYI